MKKSMCVLAICFVTTSLVAAGWTDSCPRRVRAGIAAARNVSARDVIEVAAAGALGSVIGTLIASSVFPDNENLQKNLPIVIPGVLVQFVMAWQNHRKNR